MRLVDGDKRDLKLLRKGAEAVGQQPLGRDIKQLICAIARVAVRLAQLVQTHGAVDAPGGDARVPQRHDLILHERDQRRDDERHPRQQQGGQLIAEAFPAARRHHAERVAPGKHRVDQRLLSRTECRKAKILPQHRKLVHAIAPFTLFQHYISPHAP